MKKILLGTIGVCLSAFTMAQVITDTVSIGAGYGDQVWYSLEHGIKGSAPKTGWDLAFEISGFSSSIRLNGVTGNTLWTYAHGDTADWNAIDTTGLSTWPLLFDADTSWAVGAFNVNADPSDPFDLGWGVYNLNTHHVTGDSIYILKTAQGDFRKLWIVSLASATYTFRLADLDGSNEIERTLAKGQFPDKNFAYYSITSDQNLDREPIKQSWDLLFTQYQAIIPGFGGYPSTGILHNAGVSVARVYPVNDPETYEDHASATFSSRINALGYTWKAYDFTINDWLIEDSTVYFAKALDGDIWKLIMRGFGGSANGNYIFSKEKMQEADTISAVESVSETPGYYQLYPNPASSGQFNVVFDLHSGTDAISLEIIDMQGRTVHREKLRTSSGLQTHAVAAHGLQPGVYMVSLCGENGKRITKTLSVR